MIYEIKKGKTYASKSGFLFRVLHIAKHGQDCSLPMIVYKALTDTTDCKAGQVFTISESIFLNRFYEFNYKRTGSLPYDEGVLECLTNE